MWYIWWWIHPVNSLIVKVFKSIFNILPMLVWSPVLQIYLFNIVILLHMVLAYLIRVVHRALSLCRQTAGYGMAKHRNSLFTKNRTHWLCSHTWMGKQRCHIYIILNSLWVSVTELIAYSYFNILQATWYVQLASGVDVSDIVLLWLSSQHAELYTLYHWHWWL